MGLLDEVVGVSLQEEMWWGERHASRPTASCAHDQGCEAADAYARVVVMLSPWWRVIECSGGLRWIIQRRTGGRAERPWRQILAVIEAAKARRDATVEDAA